MRITQSQKNCYREEEKEVEEDERWEEINIEVSNALYGLDKEANISKLLDEENKNLILSISKLLSSSHVSRRFFEDAQDFNQFMINEKPKEIWLDGFMEHEPYIILSFNDGVKFRGVYNHQCLLGGDNSDFTWLYKSGMYVKTFC